MLKKSLLALALFTQIAQAETCPTIDELQADLFHQTGWTVFDLNNGEPLSNDRWQAVKPKLKYFAMAKWLPDAPEGGGQCFYKKTSTSKYELEVYLAKNTLSPDNTTGNWHPVDYDSLQCDPPLTTCRYNDHP